MCVCVCDRSSRCVKRSCRGAYSRHLHRDVDWVREEASCRQQPVPGSAADEAGRPADHQLPAHRLPLQSHHHSRLTPTTAPRVLWHSSPRLTHATHRRVLSLSIVLTDVTHLSVSGHTNVATWEGRCIEWCDRLIIYRVSMSWYFLLFFCRFSAALRSNTFMGIARNFYLGPSKHIKYFQLRLKQDTAAVWHPVSQNLSKSDKTLDAAALLCLWTQLVTIVIVTGVVYACDNCWSVDEMKWSAENSVDVKWHRVGRQRHYITHVHISLSHCTCSTHSWLE